MTMDLRLEFEKMIKKNGHWVSLRKVVLNPRNQNIVGSSAEADSRMLNTTTSGHTYTDNLTLSRKSAHGLKDELSTPLGVATPASFTFYLRHSLDPTTLDWIIELELDPATREPVKPFKAINYYNIKDVHEMREHDGKIIYYRCLCEKSVWNVD